MSDYGSNLFNFNSDGSVSANGGMGLPDPGTIYNNNDGSFGNNGGSVGDNGAGGGGSAGVDNGTGSAGSNPGAPTQDDYNNLVKSMGGGAQGIAAANQIMQAVAKDNPSWAGQIGQMLGTAAKTIAGGTGGGSGSGGSSALGTTNLSMLLPALATAYQQYHNAGQYTDQAEKYAGTLNPYGSYRDAAAQKLAALQADPSSIQDTPGYKFALQQMMGAVGNRDNRSYGVGAGTTTNDMMTQAQGLASKTYNDTINQYSNQAGVNIGPSAAAGILQTGMQGNIASQNNAINALMSPFGPGNNTGGNTVNTSDLYNTLFGGGGNASGTPTSYAPNDPALIPNNPQVPSVPPTSTYPNVPNNNTGVIPGGT